MILGEDLDHTKCTKFYKELDFCLEKLGMSYTQYQRLPRWERRMNEIYLDIKDGKEQQRDAMMEEKHKRMTKGYK